MHGIIVLGSRLWIGCGMSVKTAPSIALAPVTPVSATGLPAFAQLRAGPEATYLDGVSAGIGGRAGIGLNKAHSRLPVTWTMSHDLYVPARYSSWQSTTGVAVGFGRMGVVPYIGAGVGLNLMWRGFPFLKPAGNARGIFGLQAGWHFLSRGPVSLVLEARLDRWQSHRAGVAMRFLMGRPGRSP